MSAAAALGRATVVLSVATAAAAILTVYFVAGTRIERSIVQRQTQMVVRSLLGGITLPAAASRAIRDSIPTPDPALDAAAAAQNSRVRLRAFVAVGILLVVATLVARRMAGPYFALALRASVLSGMLAACTELAFLLIVARRYESIDPNYVRLQILRQLEQDART